MIPEIDNASASDLRDWWVAVPSFLTHDDTEELVLDEIAYALTQKDANWIDFLSQYAHSKDVNRRASAVYFLADRANATLEAEGILLAAFRSAVARLQATALQGFIHTRLFPLTRDDIASLSSSADERIPAWGMTYLCYAFPEVRNDILKAAMRNENPRIREFACDVIGDGYIQELKQDMAALFGEPDKSVAESASYNYHEMLMNIPTQEEINPIPENLDGHTQVGNSGVKEEPPSI